MKGLMGVMRKRIRPVITGPLLRLGQKNFSPRSGEINLASHGHDYFGLADEYAELAFPFVRIFRDSMIVMFVLFLRHAWRPGPEVVWRSADQDSFMGTG